MFHWNSNENIHVEQLNIEFSSIFTGSWSFPTLYLTDRGYSKSLANKSQSNEVDPHLCVCSLNFTPWVVHLIFFQLVLCWAVLDCKITTHFWKGGLGGPPPENFENQENRGSHLWSFWRGNFTFRKWKKFEVIAPIYCMLFLNMSPCMRFPTMWFVRPAKPQISLRICAVWSEPLHVAWVFYGC